MITVFTQPGCGQCVAVKALLDSAGVDYEMVDISEDSEAREFVTWTLGAKAVPVITSWTHPPIFGFKEDEIRAVIETYSAPVAYGEGTWIH